MAVNRRMTVDFEKDIDENEEIDSEPPNTNANQSNLEGKYSGTENYVVISTTTSREVF